MAEDKEKTRLISEIRCLDHMAEDPDLNHTSQHLDLRKQL